MKLAYLAVSAAAIALALPGCRMSNAPGNESNAGVAAPARDWPAFVNNFIEASFRANPGFAVMQGRHEYDGQIADLSPAGMTKEVDRLKQAIADAQAYGDDKLTPEQRFERDYLVAVAKGQLFWIDPAGADQLHHNPAAYLGYVDPSVYVTVPYAPKEQRLKAYIKFLQNVPRATEQMRANIQTPMATSFVDYAKSAFGGFVDYYPGDGMAAWKGVGTPADQQALKLATDNAVKAMKDTVAWVESQRAASKPNFALGKDKFQRMLADTEMVTTPIEQLERIGRADLAANQKLLGEACSRYAPGQTIAACMEKMSADKPEGGPVAGARAQLAGLKQFIIDHDIVTIPGPEEAKVEESPPYNRQNSAYINIPGPYEKGLPSVYYIAPPDPTWPKAEQDAFIPGKADLLFTSVHEVWPGHFLNFLHANRSKDMFGRVFVGYAFAEGWAHYTEEMMRVKGVGGGTDETLIGQLSNALAARLPLPLGDRHAHRVDDPGAELRSVPQPMLPGRGQRPPAGGARDLRSGLSQLHDGQADDPQAARRLGREPRRAESVEGVPRPVPELRRPADPARPPADDGRQARSGVLALHVRCLFR